ncbi:MAG: SMC-Scp complex subunit ScpB, partial [Oscillospiraceae bacterium]
MNMEFYKGAVEAVLFAVAEPISADKIASALAIEKTDVVSLVNEIKSEQDEKESGLCILQFDDRFQMATRPSYGDFV